MQCVPGSVVPTDFSLGVHEEQLRVSSKAQNTGETCRAAALNNYATYQIWKTQRVTTGQICKAPTLEKNMYMSFQWFSDLCCLG